MTLTNSKHQSSPQNDIVTMLPFRGASELRRPEATSSFVMLSLQPSPPGRPNPINRALFTNLGWPKLLNASSVIIISDSTRELPFVRFLEYPSMDHVQILPSFSPTELGPPLVFRMLPRGAYLSRLEVLLLPHRLLQRHNSVLVAQEDSFSGNEA